MIPDDVTIFLAAFGAAVIAIAFLYLCVVIVKCAARGNRHANIILKACWIWTAIILVAVWRGKMIDPESRALNISIAICLVSGYIFGRYDKTGEKP